MGARAAGAVRRRVGGLEPRDAGQRPRESGCDALAPPARNALDAQVPRRGVLVDRALGAAIELRLAGTVVPPGGGGGDGTAVRDSLLRRLPPDGGLRRYRRSDVLVSDRAALDHRGGYGGALAGSAAANGRGSGSAARVECTAGAGTPRPGI